MTAAATEEDVRRATVKDRVRGNRLVVNHVRQNEGCIRDETLRRWSGVSWERGKRDTLRGRLRGATEAPVGRASVGTAERREKRQSFQTRIVQDLPDVAVTVSFIVTLRRG